MLRNLYQSDLGEVLMIEQSVHIIPWTENTFKACLQSGCAGWVVELDRKIIGFIVASLRFKECHILNLCVDYPYQHQGFGRKLLEHAIAQVKKQGAEIAYLEVRRSNKRAISLYKHSGFQFVGERKAYYPNPKGREDALVLAKSLHKP